MRPALKKIPVVTYCGNILFHEFLLASLSYPRTRSRFLAFLLKAEEADMKDANTYREYAADCRRMAKLMNPKDQEALLKMAAAWEDRAKEAERRKDGG
jgi:hypothetical protein